MSAIMSEYVNGIPRELHSEYEERPFQSCTRCGESLAAVPEGYQIFKLFERSEVTYEYTLCAPCHGGLMEQFSEHSRARMADFHQQRVTLNLGAHLCAVCGNERGEAGEPQFALSAACEGGTLRHCLMLCGGCLREMQALLSPETRRTWQRFVTDNLPGLPPESVTPGGLVLV
jgi:hypothetical protein